jgi:hypothetical protein
MVATEIDSPYTYESREVKNPGAIMSVVDPCEKKVSFKPTAIVMRGD